MKKLELKQLIREVIQEFENVSDYYTDVDIDLSKLGKGLTGILKYVPINYNHTDVEYEAEERPSMYSPGSPENFIFEVTYIAYEDVMDDSGNLLFKGGEEIPEKCITKKSVEKISDEIIKKFKDDATHSVDFDDHPDRFW